MSAHLRPPSARSAPRSWTRAVTTALAVLGTVTASLTAPVDAQAAAAGFTPTQLGHLTWSFATTVPADKAAAITVAMDAAINNLNTVANYSGDVPVAYDGGIPTAQASYGGRIEFGGTISPGVAQHELAHWLGAGTYWDFRNHIAGGTWTGAAAASRLAAFDGAGAALHSDGAHFWPYGWNYPNEYSSPQRQIALVAAMRADMGLSDGTAGASGTFTLRNRADGLLVDSSSTGTTAVQHSASTAAGQRWRLEAANGYWTLTNVRTGRVLDGLGRTSNGARVGTSTRSSATSQQWEIVPTDAGEFQLQNRATGTCLDTGGLGAGAVLQSWACGPWIWNQQWQFGQA